MPLFILGISCFYHDSAAVLLRDGAIVSAAQEERFTRIKHDSSFPSHSIEFCLKQAEIHLQDISYIVFYDKPFLKFERLLETYLAFAPTGFNSFQKAIPVWLKEKLFLKHNLRKELSKLLPKFDCENKLLFSEHHLSHAASAFYPSPFNNAAILVLDGVGEWATTSLAIGNSNDLKIISEINFPHSIGLLYSAFTYYTGFKVNSGEYKLMGLAPYGSPRYVNAIYQNLIDVKDDGTFRLNLDYFDFCTGLNMTNKKFDILFGGPARKPTEEITQKHMDLASSIQHVTETVLLKLTRSVARETGEENLCLAGGVALNCVANGKILRDGHFKNIWIQPAAGDAGGALGAALVAHHIYKGKLRTLSNGKDAMRGAYLGPEYCQASIEKSLSECGAIFEILSEDDLIKTCATDLSNGKVLGWFQGRMEFGPRALGGRSILGDPRSTSMQKNLNLKIKFRESFRPFAPSILASDTHKWFDLNVESPYMLLVAEVLSEKRITMTEAENNLFGIDKLNIPRSEIPSVTHVDYSARIQTVHKDTNPKYHALITCFKDMTGIPLLVNTSFNVRGEPIVESPQDAFRCFMATEMDTLAIGNCLLRKEKQNSSLKVDYLSSFQPD
jgi:carbamoyltransferase